VPAGIFSAFPLVPAAIAVPIPPPTTAPMAASFVPPPRILPSSAPPAALPPMMPAVLPVELAIRVRDADRASLSPRGVVTLSKLSTTAPPFSEMCIPLVPGATSATRPRTMLPAGMATRPPTTMSFVVVAVRESPTWLVSEPTGVDKVTCTSVPCGTVSRADAAGRGAAPVGRADAPGGVGCADSPGGVDSVDGFAVQPSRPPKRTLERATPVRTRRARMRFMFALL